MRESQVSLNSLPKIQTPSKRKHPLPNLKLPANQIQRQKSRGRLSVLPTASGGNSITSIPDIVGVEITDYCPQSTLSDVSQDEIVIDCNKFQRLPHVEDSGRGVLDNGCNVNSSAEKRLKDRKSAKPNMNTPMNTSRRLTRRATKTPNRLPRL